MAAGSQRKSPAYKALCRTVRREERDCWLCGRPIDPALPYRDPRTGEINRLSWSLDHVVPLSHGGPELDRANARAAHLGCNIARGNRASHPRVEVATLVTSREW